MSNAAMNKQLKSMEGAWGNAEAGFQKVDPGIYVFQLQSAELTAAKSGNLMIKLEHLIIDGESAGEVLKDNRMVLIQGDADRSEKVMRFTKMWIESMGFEVPESLVELPDLLEEMVGAAPTYTGKLTYQESWPQIEMQEVLEHLGVQEADEDETEAEAAPAPMKKGAKKKAKTKAKASAGFSVGDVVSFADDDGNTLSGDITVINDDDTASVFVNDEEWEEIPFSELTAGVTEEEDTGNLAALLEFASAQGLEDVDDSMDEDAVIAAINEYEWKSTDLVDDEVALLESVNVKVIKPAPKKTAKKKATTKKKTRTKK